MGFYLQGLTMGLAYVAPIGMQNLFVINSALTKTRRRALLTALAVSVFDVILSLACFFGIGTLMQNNEWLRLAVLAIGGAVVIRIGLGLLLPKRKASERQPDDAAIANADHNQPSGHQGVLRTIGTACVVTWFNPQAIVDGTLMLGAFSATLSASQSTPFITGVETASLLWFFGITLLASAFRHKFSPKILEILNKVCGVVIIAYGAKLLFDFAVTIF